MAAPDIETLLDFEVQFEDAAETFLNTAVGIAIFGTLSTTDFTLPRIDVKFMVGEGKEPVAPRGGGASSSTLEYREYDATFEASVWTDNTVGQTSDHASYRRKLREALLRSGTNWNSSNLPYYDLKYLRPISNDYETDEDLNVSILTYEVKFEIRDDAWPT